ncbi:MAG TPA: fibronectin type III domain-containing protein [Chthoniobacterales bacterium]
MVDPPYALRTKVNGTPGNVYFSWTAPTGAQFFEVQYTTDLSGETGWTSPGEMPSASKATFEGLTSGTRYSFRVRAWGNGRPGPWSTPVQQMVL